MNLDRVLAFFYSHKKLLGALFILFNAILFVRYPEFTAKALFQDFASSAISEEIKIMKGSQTEGNPKGKALIWLKSSPVLEKAIEGMDISLDLNRFEMAFLSHFKPSLFQKLIDFPIEDLRGPLKEMTLTPLSQKCLRVKMEGDIADFTVPSRIHFKGASFLVRDLMPKELIGKSIPYKKIPTHKIVMKLKKKLILSQSDQDRSVVQLMLKAPSKKRAETILNRIMLAYREKLREDLKTSLQEQIAECRLREKEFADQMVSKNSRYLHQKATPVDEMLYQMQREVDQRALFQLSSLIESLVIKECLLQVDPRPVEMAYADKTPTSFSLPLLSFFLSCLSLFFYMGWLLARKKGPFREAQIDIA
jgi:hypothetical protein